jgi:N-acetylmuramoyl-L-alanine amidase
MKNEKEFYTLLRSIATFILFLLILGSVMRASGDQFTQEETVAITILAEARGEGKRGMYAVACVISKRMEEKSKTGAQVCLQPWQFSCWNKNDPQKPHLRKLLRHELAPYAMQLAKNINNLDLGFVRAANHYHTKRVSPYWSKGKRPVATIGNHLFFKL